jgi:uncharacterized protein (TIGR03083 family)
MEVNSLGERPPEWRGAFAAGAAWFDEVAAYAVDAFDRPGLGEWTVRDLVGHTSRSLVTVEEYLTDDTSGAVEVATAAAYLAQVREVDHAAVAARGRAAAAALGHEPLTEVADLVRRVPALVDVTSPEARMRTAFGTMTLAEYLPTRTFELAVHTGDLLRALERQGEPPPGAARSALRLVADAAALQGLSTALLAALTGRASLVQGFSVL